MADPDRNQVKKIVVKSEDELTDVIRKMDNATEDRLVLSFGEHSDLLVSPINLQVIQESADTLGKPLVFQILDSRAGSRNAGEIGAVHVDDTESIDDDLWNMAYADMQNRVKSYKDSLKGPAAFTAAKVIDEVVSDDGDVSNDNVEYVGGEITEDQPNFVDNSSTDDASSELGQTDDLAAELEQKSEFQERIDNVLEKSRHDLESSKDSTVEEGGLLIAVDHDIKNDIAKGATVATIAGAGSNTQAVLSNTDKNVTTQPNLTGRDFKSKTEPQPTIVEKEEIVEKANSTPFYAAIAQKGRSIIPKSVPSKLKNKRLLLFIVLPILLITFLVLFGIYKFAPLVRITMYIESRPITVEKQFVGDPNLTEFDLETGAIPIKKEEVKKERSDSTNATGTATRGTKASGLVRFVCGPINGETGVPKTIPAGTVLTTKGDGFKYVLVSDVSFECPSTGFPTGTAEAADFGSEFNISSGVLFSVAGDDDVAATSETSFTGGSKEEYTVVSQADYDRVVNPLKETSFNEAENELNALAVDGWELVPGSVSSALDGNVVTDQVVGAEAEVLNVTVKTISTGLYYKASDIEDSVEALLLESALENNLFESDDDLELSLGEDYTSEITVVSIEGDKVTLKLVANGEVKPTVDKDAIVNDLQGMDWEEGLEYLDDLTFVAKDTQVFFEPDYFPESLRYFPSRQGRILITVKQVEVEVEGVEGAEAE